MSNATTTGTRKSVKSVVPPLPKSGEQLHLNSGGTVPVLSAVDAEPLSVPSIVPESVPVVPAKSVKVKGFEPLGIRAEHVAAVVSCVRQFLAETKVERMTPAVKMKFRHWCKRLEGGTASEADWKAVGYIVNLDMTFPTTGELMNALVLSVGLGIVSARAVHLLPMTTKLHGDESIARTMSKVEPLPGANTPQQVAYEAVLRTGCMGNRLNSMFATEVKEGQVLPICPHCGERSVDRGDKCAECGGSIWG